jgi:hypothetical protein
VGSTTAPSFAQTSRPAAVQQDASVRADLNQDGFADLAAGAPGEAVGSLPGAGAVSLLYGSASGLTPTGGRLFTQVGGTVELGDHFGAQLAAGDFNNNGSADLAAAAPSESVGSAFGAGAVSVLPGSTGGLTTAAGQLFTQDSTEFPAWPRVVTCSAVLTSSPDRPWSMRATGPANPVACSEADRSAESQTPLQDRGRCWNDDRWLCGDVQTWRPQADVGGRRHIPWRLASGPSSALACPQVSSVLRLPGRRGDALDLGSDSGIDAVTGSPVRCGVGPTVMYTVPMVGSRWPGRRGWSRRWCGTPGSSRRAAG